MNTRILSRLVCLSCLLLPSVFCVITEYDVTILDGPSESPPNASPGIGTGIITWDDVANTMRVEVTFSGLTGTTTASHIHAATTVAGTGTAGVATQTPSFSGFPLGVTSGSYDNTFDMTLSSSYNPAFISGNGATVPSAQAALKAAFDAGKAYLNIHTNTFPSGEIRGFLAAAGAQGDPQFMGFQGQSFQVHGIPDSIFAIISSPVMQVNANFAYLASGTCTYTNTPCWTHPGTYLDRIGMLLRCPISGVETRVLAIAGSHSVGMTLSINGQIIDVNTTSTQQVITLPGNNTVTVHDKDSFTVRTDIIQLTFTNSNYFFNFQTALLRPSWLSAGSRAHIGAVPSVPLHGLLGQTWLYKKYAHGQYYEGDINDYLLETQSLFATDFTYSKYQRK